MKFLLNWKLWACFAMAISSISTITIIWFDRPKAAAWNGEGFENFISYFEFPLQVLVAGAAIVTILISIDRLYKTEKQIRISEAGSLRSNYLELADSYQKEFKILKLDLKRNINYLFPKLNNGSLELNKNLDKSLGSAIKVISQTQESGLFGSISGLDILPLLDILKKLKKDLLVDYELNIKFFEYLNYQACLKSVADDFLTLIEFLSIFNAISTLEEVEYLKQCLKKWEEKKNEMKTIFDNLTSNVGKPVCFEHLMMTPYSQRILIYEYVSKRDKSEFENKERVEYGKFKKLLNDEKSTLNRFIFLQNKITEAIEHDDSLDQILTSSDYIFLLNFKD